MSYLIEPTVKHMLKVVLFCLLLKIWLKTLAKIRAKILVVNIAKTY